MGKVSVEIAFLLVVVPVCMYTVFLLTGLHLGRLLERQADDSGGGGGVEIMLGGGLHAWQPRSVMSVGPWGGSGAQPSNMRGGGGGGGGEIMAGGGLHAWQPRGVMRSGVRPSDMRGFSALRGVMSVGPWGGSGGQPFYMRGASAPRLRRIVLYHSFGAIHSLACDYTLADDVEGPLTRVAGPWGLSNSYGSIGVPIEIELSAGEHITAVEGTIGRFANVVGVVITSLAFRTSSGRTYGPYGNVAAGLDYFSIPAADGACIVGFWGRSGWILDAIGVYMKPSCSLSSSSDTAAYDKYTLSSSSDIAADNKYTLLSSSSDMADKYTSRRHGPN